MKGLFAGMKNIILCGRIQLVLCALGLLFGVFLFPFYGGGMGLHYAIVGMTGAIAALGLNILYGYCGQINFGTAGFFAIGGYGVALLEKYLHIPFLMSLTLTIIISGVIGFFVSLPLLKLREYILALGTLAFGLAVYEAASKGFTSYTRGEDGIDIAKLIVFGKGAGDILFFYILLVAVLLCYWVSYALRNSRTGRAMLAISQDEIAATSLGVNINKYLTQAFMVSGMMLALSGGLFVKWSGWCSPEYFSLTTSIVVLLSVVAGGIGSAFGVLLGGLIMFILRELLVPLAIYEMLAYGVILCGLLLYMPKGLKGGIVSIRHRFKGKY